MIPGTLFVALFGKGLTEIVTAPGEYLTRCGERVTIESVEMCPSGTRPKWHSFAAVGSYSNGVPERWHCTGRVHVYTECKNDIVARA